MGLYCLLGLVSGCGFQPNSQFAASRLQASANNCGELYITDSYSLSTNNDIAAKQVYKIETKSPADKNYDPAHSFPLYQSFINSDKLVSNISINKNIRQKACRDHYLNNIRYLE